MSQGDGERFWFLRHGNQLLFGASTASQVWSLSETGAAPTPVQSGPFLDMVVLRDSLVAIRVGEGEAFETLIGSSILDLEVVDASVPLPPIGLSVDAKLVVHFEELYLVDSEMNLSRWDGTRWNEVGRFCPERGRVQAVSFSGGIAAGTVDSTQVGLFDGSDWQCAPLPATRLRSLATGPEQVYASGALGIYRLVGTDWKVVSDRTGEVRADRYSLFVKQGGQLLEIHPENDCLLPLSSVEGFELMDGMIFAVIDDGDLTGLVASRRLDPLNECAAIHAHR